MAVVGADVVVLAGDFHIKYRWLQWVFDQKLGVPVLYVLGNHELYHDKFPGSINKLRGFLEAGDTARSIVVRHHAPSFQSIADWYRRDHLSAAFVSNMDELILEWQPRLWIHGHTHKSWEYRLIFYFS